MTWDRLRRVNPYVWDALLAVAVFGFALLGELVFMAPVHAGSERVRVVAFAAACIPLLWRRLAPITTLAFTAIVVAAYEASGHPTDFVGLAFILALYTAAAHRERRLVLGAALPIGLAAALTIYLTSPRDLGQPIAWEEVVINTSLLLGVPMVFGRIEFNRRLRGQRDLERAAHDAVAEERVRIARELHDVVAHAMGVMVVQAGAARSVVDRDPAGATAAMRRIEDTGRIGLGEMRRLLGILEGDEKAAPLVPQPGLERLDELLETVRGSGLPVEAMVEGTPRALPPGVDLAAYRVVQEALTNALKHAGRAHARVLLRYGDASLEVEVGDDGRGPPPDGAQPLGHGLIGMRERVAVFGGSLETGARQGGGFVVRARIPLLEAW
jgi:signal transduction histidine kinase